MAFEATALCEERHEAAHISLLGGFRIDGRSGPVELPGSVQRLVAYLALQDRSVHRRRVAGVLWPDVDDDRASANLRCALWRSRRAAPLIEASAASLRLVPSVGVDTRELCAAAEHVFNGGLDALPSMSSLDFELLPDWYEDWVILERERLRQLVLHVLESAVPCLVEQGRHGAAIDSGLRALRLEPLRETSHRVLIAAYLAGGNRVEAVRQYREYKRLMWTELGLPPSADTRALVECLLSDI